MDREDVLKVFSDMSSSHYFRGEDGHDYDVSIYDVRDGTAYMYALYHLPTGTCIEEIDGVFDYAMPIDNIDLGSLTYCDDENRQCVNFTSEDAVRIMRGREEKLLALSHVGHRHAFRSNDGDRYEGEISGVGDGLLQMYVGEQRANQAFRVTDVDMSSLAYYDEQGGEWIDLGLEQCLFGD